MESYTETRIVSFKDKIKNAFSGIIIGLVLFIGSFVLLYWNEGNSVRNIELNDFVRKNVISVQSETVDPANEGKLIHTSGLATTNAELSDSVGITLNNIINLKRDVKMYQWKESSHTKTTSSAGGSSTKTTTYTYKKTWSSSKINSSHFKKAGHDNPTEFPVEPTTLYAQNVNVGAFNLAAKEIRDINEPSINIALPEHPNYTKIDENTYYSGTDINNPQIGDIKISYTYVPSDVKVSVIAKQNGDNLGLFYSPKGEFSELQTGIKSASDMMTVLDQQNALITWGLRFGGFALMLLGLFLLSRPIVVWAEVLPILKSVVDFLSGWILVAISAILTLLTITVAWFVHRPIVAITLLVAIVGIIYLIATKRK